ncbi:MULTISPECIES: ABC transporter ATP-binding protein [Selenomonas]|uniref:ABC transporter ATP-binding protein n=1 Tax=Selenomonas ruminis TaxID=2593411 RepID=A0A5D6W888_9FIRM|nr:MULTISPECIES: ABC transporter ATP-binding protein [unclassified Selenomonas]MBQ1868272.1 ABC transporter ATP-binding protein [Selenomonas sp.]TYZ24020.1 ABC transporter ATP-binding protein [Selenomonas sp. mPRGC5]
MIRLVDVCKSFGDKEVLHHINLTIEDGETLAIIGGSGSGKSTLLRLLIGLIRPTSGEIWIGDTEISRLSEAELDKVRLHMGMVFQYSALFDSMTVGDNVAFGLREHTDMPEKEVQRIVEEKLNLVGLENVAHRMPNELSGGMKKRVSLARAIAFEPEIVFYDEPSSGLDPIMTEKIDELISHTQQALNVTSVVVTHDMASACRIADRIAMVYEGELIAVDTVENFKNIRDERVQAFFHTLRTVKEA